MKTNTVRPLMPSRDHPYTQLDIQYERDLGLAWYYMHPEPRPICTATLIGEMQHWFTELQTSPHHADLRYIVLASDVPGVFNLGGDLELFISLIHARDRKGLFRYAKSCIDTLALNHNGIERGMTTISLVQGDALGGGLEYAVSSDILIAERSAKMGFPEILFNLFPGMGAYSLLSRKIGNREAEKLILSGRIYSAEELHEMGVVDVLAEDGHGEKEVYDYISREDKARNGIAAFRAARKCTHPLTYEELNDVTEIWVDAALKLSGRDLRMMERLVTRQSARSA